MRSFTNFLSDLPGIMPRKTRKLILEGGLLSKEQRADIQFRDETFLDTVLEVGPDAATAILTAYKNGGLPMRKGAMVEEAPSAEAYLAKADELRRQIAERKRQDQAIKDPSLLVENDLSNHYLMDKVFIEKISFGSGSLVLAGIAVQKQVIPYKSNSGKSVGWKVRFDWTGSDGQARSSETIPSEASNRRNDPERDWGLYD